MSELRSLPSVDHLLQTEEAVRWIASYGRPLTLDTLRQVLEAVRLAHRPGEQIPGEVELLSRARRLLENRTDPSLKAVINASGVVLHTNLGRAPLSRAALQAAWEAGSGYTNLEYDLEKGKRGSRLAHAEPLLQQLTGAEAAMVVNNNAAAVLLALSALAARRKVAIARTQLVEIGGGFRVPDVMKQSGARLVEVGATNRVHLADYEAALEDGAGVVMHAHRSNFRIVGFTGEPSLEEIAAAAHRAGAMLVDDLGSGALLDTAQFGLEHEPTVQESLSVGADLVCFSGDKLLGGPQAGILVGRAELIAKCRKHPLARAIRADKIALAALSATLLHYLKDEALRQVPVVRMMAMTAEEIRERALRWSNELGQGQVIAGRSTVGGGSLPGETLPTYLLALSPRSPNRFLARLRQAQPPVIARLDEDRVLLDPRTVLPEQDEILLGILRGII